MAEQYLRRRRGPLALLRFLWQLLTSRKAVDF
jgi:hypothetical protein